MKKLILIALLLIPEFIFATPSEEEVLRAIEQVKLDLISSETFDKGQVILKYAEESSEVVIILRERMIPWIMEDWDLEEGMEDTVKNLIMISYLSGNIESQIKKGAPNDDPHSGWLLVLQSYKKLKEKIEFESESIEHLARLQESGHLMRHAENMQKN